jgi:putative transposase
MTVARQVIAGRTYLISRRCTQRQFLLRPDAHVEQVYLYCLGEAAARYEITLHGFVAMSNHAHLVIRDNHGNFPEFLAHLHKMIAKAMNARLGRWENFWATEQTNAVFLVEPEDRFRKLVYLLANPVAAGLVDRISDWPGACSLGLHLSGRSRTIARPRGYFRSEEGPMPDEVTIRLERLDGFEELSDVEWTEKLATALREEEENAREKRRQLGQRVFGRKAVLQAQPTDTPVIAEPRRNLRPCVACHDRARLRAERALLGMFRSTRLLCLTRLREGESDVIFPLGTYRIRGIFNTMLPSRPLAA